MTLSTTTVRQTVLGSGSPGPFSCGFKIFAATDLDVRKTSSTGVVTKLAYPTDYTIPSGIGDASGFTLTLTVALQSGESLSILRAVPNTQPTSLRTLGSFLPATHEDVFDRLTMLVQQNGDGIGRSVRLSPSIDPASVIGLELTPETAKVVGWASSTQLTNVTLDSSAVALPGQSRTVATLSAYLANNAVFNVADYGAKGDGVTDDSAAIARAMTAAAAVGGDVVFTAQSYNIGSGAAGLTIPANVNLVGRGMVTMTYSGSGLAWDAWTNAWGGHARNFYVICTQDAASGFKGGNGARFPGLQKVTFQANGNSTQTGTAYLLDSGSPGFFTGYMEWVQCYGLQFKFGVRVVGASTGLNTWTVMRGRNLVLLGRAAGPIAGSIGIWTDANTNAEGSRIDGLVIESFAKPYQFDSGAGANGISLEGGMEANTNAGTAGASFNGEIDDPHAAFLYRAHANSVANRWMVEQIKNGLWQSESFDDRWHTIYTGSGFPQHWGLRRGGSGINGEAVEDKFTVGLGSLGTTLSQNHYLKLLTFKIAWDAGLPTAGSYGIGSVIFDTLPVNGHPVVKVCQDSGTIRSAPGITASTTSGSPNVTVSAVGSLEVGDYISIAGAVTQGRITAISGTTVTLATNATGTVTGIAVTYYAPTLRTVMWAPGPAPNNGDASVTLTATSQLTQRFDTALTANRTVTLPANAASDHGQKFRITRTGLGAFTLTVQDASSTVLKAMPSATAAWCDVEFSANTNTWQLAAYGTL